MQIIGYNSKLGIAKRNIISTLLFALGYVEFKWQ